MFKRKRSSFAGMPLDRTKVLLLTTLLSLCLVARSQDQYPLQWVFTGKDTTTTPQALGLRSSFNNKGDCQQYLARVVTDLRAKGWISASLDSIRLDSLAATAWMFPGERYLWAGITEPAGEEKLLQETDWSASAWKGKPVDMARVSAWQEKALAWLENHGYPFAKVQLDSLRLGTDGFTASLLVDRGPLYHIDSLRNVGKAHISNDFLQRYLGIQNGSLYRRDKLDAISRRILELPYLKESKSWDLTMLGNGSTLNLYLDPKKSSQINALVGFLPASGNNGGKLLMTGEANINLKNALGGGETIGVNWQQLQAKSPRLDLAFSQPYMFHSAFGFDFHFNLYKRDSTYLNLNLQVGLQYLLSARQSGRIFYQLFRTNLLYVDTNFIKYTKQLPSYLDVGSSNLGVDYQYNNTDYRFNPRRGNELSVVISGGIRTVRKNSNITSLTEDATGDPYDFNHLYDTVKMRSYLVRLRLNAAHHFQLAKRATVRAALQGGWMQTQQSFNNEVFQVGGYKLMRGFDEESIFATDFAVGTAEYRYLIGLNSFLFAFSDYGWARNRSYGAGVSHTYLGLGGGIAFETKAGIINLSYAVGKRNDLAFSFRQSKIHIGFVSLF